MIVKLVPYIVLLSVSCADFDAIGQETYLLQTVLEVTRKSLGKVVAEKDGGVSLQTERGIACKPAQTDALVSVDGWSLSSSHATLASSREPGARASGKSEEEEIIELHDSRKAELETLTTEGVDFVLYGASIMERWRETVMGAPCPVADAMSDPYIVDCEGNKEVWHKFFGPSRPAVMAVSGDTTADLLWRLEHGEAPIQQPTAIFVQIGANNIIHERPGFYRFVNPKTERIYADAAPPRDEDFELAVNETYFGIEAVLRKLLMSCQVPIIVTALFPSGYLWPSGPFGKIIPQVNALLKDFASRNAEFVHVIDCSSAALITSSSKIDPALMPDFSHLSPKGMEIGAECMYRGLQDI